MTCKLYYRRDGTPCESIADLGDDFWNRDESRRVAETTLPDGKWISTVHLGICHSVHELPSERAKGAHLIFETMVFASKQDMDDLDRARYATEKEALAGHEKMVRKWRAKQ